MVIVRRGFLHHRFRVIRSNRIVFHKTERGSCFIQLLLFISVRVGQSVHAVCVENLESLQSTAAVDDVFRIVQRSQIQLDITGNGARIIIKPLIKRIELGRLRDIEHITVNTQLGARRHLLNCSDFLSYLITDNVVPASESFVTRTCHCNAQTSVKVGRSGLPCSALQITGQYKRTAVRIGDDIAVRAVINFTVIRRFRLRRIFYFVDGDPAGQFDVPGRIRLTDNVPAADDSLASLAVIDRNNDICRIWLIVIADSGDDIRGKCVTVHLQQFIHAGCRHGLPLVILLRFINKSRRQPAAVFYDSAVFDDFLFLSVAELLGLRGSGSQYFYRPLGFIGFSTRWHCQFYIFSQLLDELVNIIVRVVACEHIGCFRKVSQCIQHLHTGVRCDLGHGRIVNTSG